MKKAVVINSSCHFNCCNSCSKTYNIDGQLAGCGSSEKARLQLKLHKEKKAKEAADYIAQQEQWKPELSEVLQVVDGYRKDTKMPPAKPEILKDPTNEEIQNSRLAQDDRVLLDDVTTEKIRNETMNGRDLNSGQHVQYDSFDVKKDLPLPLHELKPPLSQPPPPAGQLSRDTYVATGTIATSDAPGLQVAGCKSSAIVQSTAFTESFSPTVQASSSHHESFSPTVQASPSHPKIPNALPQQIQQQVAAPSSAGTAVLDTPRYSHAIAILPYNPRKEPEPGYLKVEKGTVIAVMSGSRSAAEQRNAHVCDYVFAWQGQRGGWIPVEILESVPPCPEIMQKTNQSFSKGRLDSQTFQM